MYADKKNKTTINWKRVKNVMVYTTILRVIFYVPLQYIRLGCTTTTTVVENF
jgi:hypothetical protein